MTRDSVKIGPSVLAADYLNLGSQLQELADADYIHFDVMDGQFVPNISIGLPVLEAIRRGTTLPIDTHLMIVEPERWIDQFAEAGSTSITIHAEATPHLHRAIQLIRATGVRAGVAVNPGTSLQVLDQVLPLIDTVLIMTVNPGFGNQNYLSEMNPKIQTMRRLIDTINPDCDLQVDGGISQSTIGMAAEHGANSFVAGTAVFEGELSLAENIASLRNAIQSQR